MTTTNVSESSTHLDDRFSVGLVVPKTSGKGGCNARSNSALSCAGVYYNGIARVKTKASTARRESFGIAFVARPSAQFFPQKYRERDGGASYSKFFPQKL